MESDAIWFSLRTHSTIKKKKSFFTSTKDVANIYDEKVSTGLPQYTAYPWDKCRIMKIISGLVGFVSQHIALHLKLYKARQHLSHPSMRYHLEGCPLHLRICIIDLHLRLI